MFSMNGKKFPNLADHGVGALVPPSAFKEVTPAATALPDGFCRGLWASDDCTIDFTDVSGNEIEGFPLAKGRNDVPAQIVAAVSAGTVWAMY